jgi:two-component system sensor histidine kinase KdpD
MFEYSRARFDMPTTDPIQRGKLKVYLGYAAGVGKTFQMLADGQAAAQRGVDVVLAYFEPHARPDTIAQTQGLEVIPHRKVEYRGTTFQDLDAEAVLQRRPSIALIDELAHTNIHGSIRAKRWEDVEFLLDAGIEVWTTMNLQHIESLNDEVRQITGVLVRETVPDGIIRRAEEVVSIDVTPEALLNRIKRGAIYKPEMIERALAGFFKGSNLGALRELALRQAAHELDLRRTAYDKASAFPLPQIFELSSDQATSSQQRERILIHITADPSTAMLIRRGHRAADYLHADCMALFVHETAEFAKLSAEEQKLVEEHLRFARSLQIEAHVMSSRNIVKTVVDYARRNHVTQIFVANVRRGFLDQLRGKNDAENIVRLAQEMQVTVVADRSRRSKDYESPGLQR